MKRITKALVALGAAGALLLGATAAFAGGATSTTWKDIDTNPNGICGYSHAEANGTPPLPGSDYYVAYGLTTERDQDPCAYSLPSNLALGYGTIKVQVSLRCRTLELAGSAHTIWTGNVKLNTAGYGTVSGGLPWSQYGTPSAPYCVADTGLTAQIQTVVHSWYLTAFGYIDYTHSTAWVNADTP